MNDHLHRHVQRRPANRTNHDTDPATVLPTFAVASRPAMLALLALFGLWTHSSAAEPSTPASSEKTGRDLVPIFDGKTLKDWLIIDQFDFRGHGKVTLRDGVIYLPKGKPATGISYQKPIPRSNYELRLQAKRVEGSDFFCGLTFPVKQEHCTLILGGWGGNIVGLSNLDGFSAIENETTQVIDFEEGRWYDILLKVTDEKIVVHLDGKPIIDVKTGNKKFSIWWEQEPVTPLGIVTWRTTGAIRNLQLRKVAADGERD